MKEPRDIKCVLVQGLGGDKDFDWYTLERAEHDGSDRAEWLHPRYCVEGPAFEWRAIAWAIEHGDSERWRRCAATRTERGYEFESPRNSNGDAVLLTFEAADRIASEIRRVLGSGES